ncbi:hypothetical protein KP509_09G008200 [Ceratopteris richardii]|nr:hypothetical protein KP509_09G008200 [Ceratopteris richardii]
MSCWLILRGLPSSQPRAYTTFHHHQDVEDTLSRGKKRDRACIRTFGKPDRWYAVGRSKAPFSLPYKVGWTGP